MVKGKKGRKNKPTMESDRVAEERRILNATVEFFSSFQLGLDALNKDAPS